MPSRRLIEIDLLRSLAIALMVMYHAAFDLWFFLGLPIDLHSLPWVVVQKSSVILFLLLVGVSVELSYRSLRRSVMRFLRIGVAATIVTVVTLIVLPDAYVRFGVLHLIALSSLLMFPLRLLREWNALIGMLIIVFGERALRLLFSPSAWLIPVGLAPEHFSTLDYVPLVPWFGVVLIGNAIGSAWFTRYGSITRSFRVPQDRRLLILAWPGRHALIIYLVHQPLLLLGLLAYMKLW